MRFLPSQAAENSASERYSEGGTKLFGYVLPYQADLKVWQWQAYRAYYCGLCMQLKERYGFLPRFVLNYDFVFLVLQTLFKGTRSVKFPKGLQWPLTQWF